MGRAFRNREKRAQAEARAQARWEEPVPEDRPGPNAPIEERRAWLLQQHGPGFFAPEVLEEMRERTCAMPDCEGTAVARSLFCLHHHNTAVGEAGARELRQLTREMERLSRITDKDARAHAVRKFRSRVERGDFAILFSGKMQETLERAAADAQLGLELGALRVAMVRAIQEIDDPVEMSLAISRIANASARTARANAAVRQKET
jgi:hypothetical protein